MFGLLGELLELNGVLFGQIEFRLDTVSQIQLELVRAYRMKVVELQEKKAEYQEQKYMEMFNW